MAQISGRYWTTTRAVARISIVLLVATGDVAAGRWVNEAGSECIPGGEVATLLFTVQGVLFCMPGGLTCCNYC